MKVLVTGGGFVGSQVCSDLLREGHLVHCIDNQMLSCDHLISLSSYANFSYEVADVRDYKVNKDTQLIIHTAGVVGAPKVDRDVKLAYDINVNGTKNIANQGIPVVNCSTGSVYGKVENICTEDSPLNATSEYGRQKKEAEDIISSLKKSVSLRFSTGCGVGIKFRRTLLPNTLTCDAMENGLIALAQGEAFRTFISVQDMSDALIWSGEQLLFGRLSYKVYNCGDNSLNMTKQKLAEKIQEETSCKIVKSEHYIDPDQRDYQVDFSRINDLGWRANVSMKEIIQDVIKVYPILHANGAYE